MTDLARLLDVRFGLHAADDYLTLPATLRRVQLVGGGASLMPRNLTPLSRNEISNLDGVGFAHLYGPVDLADITPQMEFKGVNSNTGAAVADWAPKMEQADMLTSLFGVAAPATVGAAPTAAASGHTSTTIVVSSTVIENGDIIGFPSGGTALEWNVRRVTTGGGTTTLGLDANYNGTPITGATIIRAARWSMQWANRNHLHGGFRVEGANHASDFLGCAPVSMALAFPEGGKVLFDSVWSPTDGGDADAKHNPATTPPTAGSPIVAINSQLFIGAERFIPRDLAFSMSTGNTPRTTPASPNGVLGGVQAEKRGAATLSFNLYFGDSGARGEVRRASGLATLPALLGRSVGAGVVSTTRTIVLQVGGAAGRSMSIHMPAADIVSTVTEAEGMTMVNVVATATNALHLGVL